MSSVSPTVKRGDGVGLEVGSSIVRGMRFRHDRPGRLAGTAEVPFSTDDERTMLDALTLLHAELGAPHEPTRLATFPPGSLLQRVDATGRSGPELNQLRANLVRRHGIASTVIIDDGPRRWLVLVSWDAALVGRIEHLALRAGFLDVAVEPSPVALARVLPPGTTYAQRLVAQGEAFQAGLSQGSPIAASDLAATARLAPDVTASDVDVPLAWFDVVLPDDSLAATVERVRGAATTYDAARSAAGGPDPRGDAGATAVSTPPVAPVLRIGDEEYPPFPPHDVRSPLRQAVALGAAAGAAGLAGRLRPLDMVPPPEEQRTTDLPWAVERRSDVSTPDEADDPGAVRRAAAALRRRRPR